MVLGLPYRISMMHLQLSSNVHCACRFGSFVLECGPSNIELVVLFCWIACAIGSTCSELWSTSAVLGFVIP